MANYYFVGTLLPDLQIGQEPEIKFDEFIDILRENLSDRDFFKTRILRLYFDIENLRSLWNEEPLDPRANLNKFWLEDALLKIEKLPKYVRSYLEQYQDKDSRLRNFPSLFVSYFRDESKSATGILKKILVLQRAMWLIQTAFRAKKLGRDLEQELQFEDPEDPIVLQLLAQKDEKEFHPPIGFEDLKRVFDERYESPFDLHKALTEFIFSKIQAMIDYSVFSFDRILGYMMQLILVEQWSELDKEKGVNIIDTHLKG